MTATTQPAGPIDPDAFENLSLRALYHFRQALDGIALTAEPEEAAELAMRIGHAVERAAIKRPAEAPADSLTKFVVALAHGVPIPDKDLGPMMHEARRVLALELGEATAKPS